MENYEKLNEELDELYKMKELILNKLKGIEKKSKN